MPIARDEAVASAKELLQSRNAVHPGEQMPRRQPAVNLVHGIRPDIDLPASMDEAQAVWRGKYSKRPVLKSERERTGNRSSMPSVWRGRYSSEATVAVKAANAADAPQAETAFAVVHDYRKSFAHILRYPRQPMSLQVL